MDGPLGSLRRRAEEPLDERIGFGQWGHVYFVCLSVLSQYVFNREMAGTKLDEYSVSIFGPWPVTKSRFLPCPTYFRAPLSSEKPYYIDNTPTHLAAPVSQASSRSSACSWAHSRILGLCRRLPRMWITASGIVPWSFAPSSLLVHRHRSAKQSLRHAGRSKLSWSDYVRLLINKLTAPP